ncbi:nuclear transport factor 2 family protein [Flammeovirgaceae bacterium SG7u.111]|nr:nuclear transport factor 2 family protein [Flammeovirgaceae bacterium SG7u.132]WPO33930.1 nuclear transport factor 2 family protein [Flammeovirgaceae bacterium SG7u.111]
MKKRTTLLFCSLAILLFSFSNLKPEEEKDVRATIEQLFDGMKKGDSTMVRGVFHPEARLQTVASKDGKTELHSTPISKFAEAVGTPHDKIWDERILSYEIKIDGEFASAWTEYNFYHGDKFSHCGVNAFHLVKTSEGWKILQITDTRRKEGCE